MATAAGFKYGEVGARIRRARKSKGFSQERFAPLIGITRRHLIRLENGEHHPSPELRERLAEHTGEAAAHFSLDEDDEESDLVADLFKTLRALVREEVKALA
jgi:transcriptional regulator with XRE-family HTH domain